MAGKCALPAFLFAFFLLSPLRAAESSAAEAEIPVSTISARQIRGIHVTSWWAGSPARRKKLLKKISGSVINAVVVAVKETDGRVYIPGVKSAVKYGSYLPAIRNPRRMTEDFDKAGLYKIARIVAFRDDYLPEIMPELSVKSTDYQTPWRNRKGGTWLDPYNRKNWDYILETAQKAAELGFDEIQFDYIRYPSEGDTALCRYSAPHNEKSATDNIAAFLKYARGKLRPEKVKISAAIFGLTTTAKNDMGIGQSIVKIAAETDYIYPMMYPSHYYPGSYGLKNPDAEPFRVIKYGLEYAKKNLGNLYFKITPYLQDFSIAGNYGPHQVRAQIIAARLEGTQSWILWNPSNRYTWKAISPQSYRNFVDPDYP